MNATVQLPLRMSWQISEQLNPAQVSSLPSQYRVRKWVQMTLQIVLPVKQKVAAHAITIRWCGTSESRRLNRQFRHKDYATNVLSFSEHSDVAATVNLNSRPQLTVKKIPKLPKALAGELLICWPVLQREAKLAKISIQDHAAHLVIHGTLHLLGFDHEKKTDAMAMEALEVAILKQLAITNPYQNINF